MEKETDIQLIAEKKELIKKITDNNQTMWIGIIVAILFCWTVIGAIIGIIIAVIASEDKRKCNQKMVDVDFKLQNINKRR